ncbi:MAG: hypothetical protein MUE51_05475, partial [Thermoleophilia bacterium]|nr:hypothetical protein [Thermoleophilia bacterium]
MRPVRVRMDAVLEPFAPRARWALGILLDAAGAAPEWVDEGPAEVVYAPVPPAEGVWIPVQHAAQAFFAGPE